MTATNTAPLLQKKRVIKRTRTWGETYLANYNAISAFFWFNIPLRLIQIYQHLGPEYVHGIADYVKYVQTVAILELVHSATGLVRSPIMTSFVQVFSRIFVVWGIVDLFPNSAKNSHAYPIMLFAWSITEIIRYSFYAWNTVDEAPFLLVWLRYSTFWVLYPLGVGAELWTMKNALIEAYAWQPVYAAFIVTVMVGYIPGTSDSYDVDSGFYNLFTHMVRQRRKVLGKAHGKKAATKKEQ